MNYTKEQFETLKKYESSLFTACYCKFVRTSGRKEIEEVDAIYRKVFKKDKGITGACQHCLFEAYKSLGKLYFEDKAKYEEEAKKEAEATETTPIDLIQPECATTETKTEKPATKKKTAKKTTKKK